ncbi:hypothetical protein AAHA92_29113 [Salvia divinorum]|uniref:Uncharacterized protein n=1 Tax=Salvia divinorum TaxID=28513 RepID=A0ABD1FX90_SALDI
MRTKSESKSNPNPLVRCVVCSPASRSLTKPGIDSCLTPSRHPITGSLRAVADHLRLRRAALAAVVSQLRTD